MLGGQQRAGKNTAAQQTSLAASPLPLARPDAHSLPDQRAGTEPPNLGGHRIPPPVEEARLRSQPKCPPSPVLGPGDGHPQAAQSRVSGSWGRKRRLAGPQASSGAALATQLEPGPKTVVPHRRAGVRREVGSWGLVCDQCRVPSGSLRQQYTAGLQRGLGGHPGPLGTPARLHIADPPHASSSTPLSVPPPAVSLSLHLRVSDCP